jgi:hypothetical protein
LRELPIYAFDVRDGAAEWTDVERHWNRSEREFGSPPRIVMIDHFADMTYKGSQEFHDFNRVLVEAHIRTVSTGATGIWLNQRNEGGNKGKQGRSAGSYGGGKFTAKVDHLIEVNPTNDDQSVLQISFERSRWGAKGDLYYSILKNSGFIVNNAFIPDGVDIYDDDTWRDAA